MRPKVMSKMTFCTLWPFYAKLENRPKFHWMVQNANNFNICREFFQCRNLSYFIPTAVELFNAEYWALWAVLGNNIGFVSFGLIWFASSSSPWYLLGGSILGQWDMAGSRFPFCLSPHLSIRPSTNQKLENVGNISRTGFQFYSRISIWCGVLCTKLF